MTTDSKNDDQFEIIQSEIDLLKTLRHPNIVKYIDTMTSNGAFNIVMEYVEGGSLALLIKQHGVLDYDLAALVTRRVLKGLAYLHEQGIVHRDIKGANILYGSSGQVKLADFGMAKNLSDVEKGNSVAGSIFWSKGFCHNLIV